MCHSFFAKNFRAFEKIEIPKLNKVNLFLGKNSVGKTALLEALYLHLHANKIRAIQTILVKKDEHLPDRDDYLSVGSVVRHLFHNHKLPDFDKEGVVFGEMTKQGKPAKNKLTKIKTTIDNDNDEVLEVVKNKDKNHVLLKDDFDNFDDFYRRSRFMRRYSPRSMETNNNLQFVYSSGSGDIVRMWDNIDLTDKQNKVIKALQIIEPNLTGIKFVEQGRRRDRAAKASINGTIVPFKSMGDGINRILYIILSMVNAQDGYLLIDEFENGLHYSVQERVWGVIFTLAESLNVQVFATTHSSDCIKAFGAQWKDNEKNATMHRINYKDKQHSVMSYNFTDLNDALNTNTEVR